MPPSPSHPGLHPDGAAAAQLDAAVVVVGTGIAGLTFALKAAEHGSVLVITKKDRADSNTNYARGGIAAVLGPDDSPSIHVQDTLKAGRGLCHPEIVEMVMREGPARAAELVEWGVRFQRAGGRFVLGREGGHSRRRILKAGDRTGREIERALLESVATDPRIRVEEDTVAVDLLMEEKDEDRRRCVGLLAADRRTGRRMRIRSAATMLAAGGCGRLYRHTTNPSIATGDGVAMAWRAGARMANLEFIQFHPTALYPTEDPAFLLTEALRGEGGVLRRLDGTVFMDAYHPAGSLAPRDVVARAIHSELERSGDPHVLLDVSAIPMDTLTSAFPGAVEGCRRRGIELSGEGIPVVPAAHYSCGGIRTDAWGRSSVRGLYAAGEVACTGLHGANRLASNSLLEAVVFSHRAAQAVVGEAPPPEGVSTGEAAADAVPIPGSLPEKGPALRRLRDRLRNLMWQRVGIVRSDAGLDEAQLWLESRPVGERPGASMKREGDGPEVGPPGDGWSLDALELQNLLQVARLVVESARWRRESRGLHHNRDHPDSNDARYRRDTVIRRGPDGDVIFCSDETPTTDPAGLVD